MLPVWDKAFYGDACRLAGTQSTITSSTLTMKASATARLAGGRGNELLIQVYICEDQREPGEDLLD